MAEVTRNTPGVESNLGVITVTASKLKKSFKRNILHNFRSFNYLFTLSACPPEALNDSEKVIQMSEQYVIAKSSGKKINQLNTKPVSADSVTDEGNAVFDAINLVESFNNRSPGRFDLFLNNIEIETLMAFSESTNLSMATKIRFEVFENLSINGFLEALQVSAQTSGNYTYINSPYILKVEFLGYLDDETGPSETVESAGEQATRYFVINITKVEVETNETGTRYRCQAVAHNEMGYGDHNSLKEPIQMRGTTVYDILKNLEESLNAASKNALIVEATGNDSEESKLHDEYEIIFPTPDWSGNFDYNTPWEKLKTATLVEVTESPAVFSFPSPGEVQSAYDPAAAGAGRGFINPTFDPNVVVDIREKQTYKFDANRLSVTFPKGAKIHDIISAVIRDSKFGRDIITKIKENPKEIVQNHMIEFVHTAIEVTQTNPRSARFQKPVFKYRYVVLPYKMHYSRIPMLQNLMSNKDQNTLQDKYILRKYEYLYTGKNVDIRKFNLQFNHLFYQAYPRNMGNAYNSDLSSNSEGIQIKPEPGRPNQSDIDSGNVVRNSANGEPKKTGTVPVSLDIAATPRHSDPARAATTGVAGNANIPKRDTYDALLKNMHQAILNNTDMIRCEIEILGDPYFLVTGGIGNYRPKLINDTVTANGEAPYQTNEVIVQLEFRNPEDIDPITGSVKFNSNRIPFGGCFRVINVTNKFTDGMFVQVLKLVRIPGQAINDVAPENLAAKKSNNNRTTPPEPTNNNSYAFFDVTPLSQIIVPSDPA